MLIVAAPYARAMFWYSLRGLPPKNMQEVAGELLFDCIRLAPLSLLCEGKGGKGGKGGGKKGGAAKVVIEPHRFLSIKMSWVG